MAKIRRLISDVWLEGVEIEGDLGELVNMFGRNQLGSQYPSCVGVEMKEFPRGGGGELVRSLGNGRMSRRASIDISEIRRRAEMRAP